MKLQLDAPSTKDAGKPHFNSVTILPEKGMNIWQINAYIPGLGNMDLMHAIPLSQAQPLLEDKDNLWGNESFKQGGAFLLPYANRIRGVVSKNGKTLEANIAGQKTMLPANWQGGKDGAEKHAIHGLLLNALFEEVVQRHTLDTAFASGVFHAGDFNGHWPSKTDVYVSVVLNENFLELIVSAKNVGQIPLPMGIGWHPYFILPSGKRQHARLHLPAYQRVLVNNYDDVFPIGQLESVKQTPYDFTAFDGKPLNEMYLDDCFTHIQGDAVIKIIDSAANYILQIEMLSPEINAIQIYAPPDKNFIAIEPQFNLADPFMKAWDGKDTGMILLQPGEAVDWKVRLSLSNFLC